MATQANLDAIIKRLTDEKTPFTRLSRQALHGALKDDKLSFEQANKLIDDAQAQAAGTAPHQEPPDITVDELSRIDRGRGMSEKERAAGDISPEQSLQNAMTQFQEMSPDKADEAFAARDKSITPQTKKVQGEIRLSDNRTFQVDATEDEITRFISEQEALIDDAKMAAADAGDEQSASGVQQDIQDDRKAEVGTFLGDVASNLVAEADIGMTLLTGALAEPVSGIVGILGLGMSLGNVDTATKWVEAVSEWGTWSPKSDKAKAALGYVGEKMLVVEETIDDIAVTASRGNPLAATAIKTAILGSIDIFSGGKGFIRKIKVDRSLKKVQKVADDLGINTDPTMIKTSLVEKIKKMTPDEIADNQLALRKELIEAEAAQKTKITNKFEEAKDIDAYVKADSIEDFGRGMREHLIDEGFDLDDMKKVNDTLNDLADIRTRKPGRGARDNTGEFQQGAVTITRPGTVVDVQLNDLQLIRKRLNRRYSKSPDAAEANKALNKIKDKLDDFLANQFDTDAVRGDKQAIKRWKDANDSFAQYKRDFSTDRYIRKMIEEDATPEQYRKWFIGASAMGAAPQVGNTIKALKKILGDNSPQMDAIRMDLLHDVARPIFEGKGGKPDMAGFVRNYDRMIGQNPSLVNALDLRTSDLKQLRNFAKAELSVRKRRFMNLDLSTAVARFVFGHKIARAAMKVTMARGVIDMVFQTGKTGRRSLLASALGNPDLLRQPLIPRGLQAAGGVIVSEFNQRARKNEKEQDERNK